MNIKDSFCNKHCRISLHDVGGKLVQTLDSGVGWGWGWGQGNVYGNGDGDFFCGDGVGMRKISWGWDGDGKNFMGMGRGWGQFYLPCHSVQCTLSVLLLGNMSGLLLASDVAARGLDIPGVQHVIHYQVPRTTEVCCDLSVF